MKVNGRGRDDRKKVEGEKTEEDGNWMSVLAGKMMISEMAFGVQQTVGDLLIIVGIRKEDYADTVPGAVSKTDTYISNMILELYCVVANVKVLRLLFGDKR